MGRKGRYRTFVNVFLFFALILSAKLLWVSIMKPFYKDWVVWVVVGLAVTTFFIAAEIELFEAVYQYTRAHEDWQLDEYFSLAFILPVVLPLLMYRANRRLRTVITEKEEAEAHATHLALHDVLTGLGNRRKFTQHMDAKLKREPSPKAALILVDLDGFKAVNDKHGHRVGDGLLQVIAARINLLTDDRGLCVRLGGDEFAVVMDAVNPKTLRQEAEVLAEAICETVGDKVSLRELPGVPLRVTASVGVAFLPPSTDPSDLLREADRAMYKAKQAGKNRWHMAALPTAGPVARAS